MNNFWGTADEATIESMLLDKSDDLTLTEYISFKPYLYSPDSRVP